MFHRKFWGNMKPGRAFQRTKAQGIKVKPGKLSQELFSCHCAVLCLALRFSLANNIWNLHFNLSPKAWISESKNLKFIP